MKNNSDMIKRSLICLALLAVAHIALAEDLAALIDTRVGTAQSTSAASACFGKNTEVFGQCIPAVLEPNGMNFWTAQTQDTELKGKAPYYHHQKEIQGFRNSHWIVGGCTQDYGSMTIMPVVADNPSCLMLPQDRCSEFSHDSEVARPDYYSVRLNRYDILAEMTGRSRSAIFRFTYPDTKDYPWVVINPNSDEGEGYIEIDVKNREIRGYNPIHRIYQGKGKPAGHKGYFVAKFDCDFEEYGTSRNIREDSVTKRLISAYDETKAENALFVGAFVHLKLPHDRVVTVKVGTSFTSIEAARQNLDTEIPHWDFNQTRQELNEIWNKHLGRIEIPEIGDDAEKARQHALRELFYGSLYRASFLPHDISDCAGTYPKFASGETMHLPEGVTAYYDDFSMWDTYRALHPLLTLLEPTKSGEMMQSLVLKAEQGGWLPIFPCWNSYTAAMIGDHCSAAIADAMVKGVSNFDWQKAYSYMRRNAFEHPNDSEYVDGKGRRALKSYLRYGFIPVEDPVEEAYHKKEQTSRTLEYAFDDFAVAQAAKLLNKKQDYTDLMARSKNYEKVFDRKTGYVEGRYINGSLTDGGPFAFSSFLTEGASCHYSWYVPHDVKGLVKLMGGKKKFVAKLDTLFNQQRYWHGNEPCHQIPYLYNYADKPKLTQKWVRYILATEYFNSPAGMPGNTDAGQMDAWYLFSAMGFYPVCPASTEYALSSPIFPKIILHLENGKTFTIESQNYTEKNIFIQKTTLNGKKLKTPFLTHEAILSGGTLMHSLTNK